jgi:nucleoside phosphorylase
MREHDIFVTIQGMLTIFAVGSATLFGVSGRRSDNSRTLGRKIRDTRVVVVLTALGTEYDAVRAFLRAPVRTVHPAGTIFEIGGLDGIPGRIALAEIGTGNQAAAAITERAIAVFRPRAVLFVGIAGALHDDLELGSVVVATKVYGYHGGTDETGAFQARPQAWDADHALDQLAREVHRTGSWTRLSESTYEQPPAVWFRPVAAGEVVLNSQMTALAGQLRAVYSDAATIEMESAGTAKAAHLNRVPFLTVRGVSDRADGSKYAPGGVAWRAVAAANAAAFAIAVARSALMSTVDSGRATRSAGRPHDGEVVAPDKRY